ncbi:MAG: fasciclin domain-containing protein [Pseudomonadota bacterium]
MAIGILALSLQIGAQTARADQSERSIFEYVSSNDELSTFAEALEDVGLQDVLDVDGPFTVFAPTNSAFAALPADEREALFDPDNRWMLVALMEYHIVPSDLPSEELVDGASPFTMQGTALEVARGEGVAVNGAPVIEADVAANNGIVHVIDLMLLREGWKDR